MLLGEAREGPPWAVEWADDNPFEPREIAAEVSDALGRTARDVVFLKPYEVVERAEVSSVLIEASVQDRFGRFVTGIPAVQVLGVRGRRAAGARRRRPETLPATYTLLVDSSQSMSRRMDFVREAAATLAGNLRPQDQIIVAPFSKTLGPVTGPTDDRATVSQAICQHPSEGRHRHPGLPGGGAALGSALEGRHAIVLITDGYDEHSTKPFRGRPRRAFRRMARPCTSSASAAWPASASRASACCSQVAEGTGGRAFFPAREFELSPVHEQVASDVQQRYLIGYTPTNQKAGRHVAADHRANRGSRAGPCARGQATSRRSRRRSGRRSSSR